ncbi:MAG: copper homeostasis protein CutC [Collinsella sp.]|nr:copper homeostasis protein CutC [Collinsella sp.]
MMLREFCAENMTDVPAAIAAGAARIELCDNLAVGGTTPGYGVIRAAVAFAHARNAQVMVMARPRGGSFEYDDREARMILDGIALIRRLGADGAVFGCLIRDGATGELTVDRGLVRRAVQAAKGPLPDPEGSTPLIQLTFHMAFDVLTEERQREAIDVLAGYGVDRILTHGGDAATPIEGNLGKLSGLVDYADGRIAIMPGGGITYRNAEAVSRTLGVNEVHGTNIVSIS